MTRVLLALAIGLSVALCCQQATAKEFNVTAEGVKLLKHIANKDKFVQDLPKGVNTLSAINTALNMVTPGPVKIVITWNKGLIAGWKAANKNLIAIGKHVTCLDLTTISQTSRQTRSFLGSFQTREAATICDLDLPSCNGIHCPLSPAIFKLFCFCLEHLATNCRFTTDRGTIHCPLNPT